MKREIVCFIFLVAVGIGLYVLLVADSCDFYYSLDGFPAIDRNQSNSSFNVSGPRAIRMWKDQLNHSIANLQQHNNTPVHRWDLLPNFVCMQNASFFTTKDVATATDTGGTQTYRINVNPPQGHVIWRSTLIIAFFSCEGNLHHIMTETLHPIVNALESIHDRALVAIGASYGLAPWNAGKSGCHGATFYPLFGAFNVEPVLFSFGDRKSTPRENVFPAPNERWDMNNVYCFRETKQVSDNAHSASLSSQLLSWAGCSQRRDVRVAIVQRKHSRRIQNMDDLLQVAKSMAGDVSVLFLEEMTMQEQVQEMACGNMIVAGVQGAGLQWTTLWENTRNALIEWGWRDWNSYYAGRVGGHARSIFRKISDENIHETCPVQRTGACCCPSNTSCLQDGGICPWPTKNVDVVVDLASWSRDLAEMIAFVEQK